MATFLLSPHKFVHSGLRFRFMGSFSRGSWTAVGGRPGSKIGFELGLFFGSSGEHFSS